MSWEQLKYVNSSLKCSCGGFTWESHPVSLLCPELTQEGEKVAFSKECGSFWVVLALKILFNRYNCMKKNFSFVRLACLSLCLLPLMFCFYLTTWWLRICTCSCAHAQCVLLLLLQDTRAGSLKAEGVKVLSNWPVHANKVPWSWSSRQTPGYYSSIWHP